MSADSDEYLIRYILRDLPDSEADRLDEQSVTDEAFARRLYEVESDLADRYARKGATDESLNRFEQRVRDSSYLRNKVQFARALQQVAMQGRTGAAPAPVLSSVRRRWREVFAAAAMLLLVASGYLGLRTVSLREDVARLQAERTAVARHTEQLQRDLEAARATPQSVKTEAYLLAPPRRGADEQTLRLPSDTTQVLLRVVIETSEYETFWASLQDSMSGRTLWRSGDVSGTADGANRIIQVTIPVNLVKSGRYSLDVSGRTRTGIFEPAGTYPLRVMLE
jgi:hypothetical protein